MTIQAFSLRRCSISEHVFALTGIPYYANQVINGKLPETLTYKNITFHNTNVEHIETQVSEIISKSVNPEDVQIVGMTKRGYKQRFGGIETLNRECQKVLNPHGKRFEFDSFGRFEFVDMRVGDPILFTQKDYDKGIFNGTLGRLTSTAQTDNAFGTVLTDDGETVEVSESLLDNMVLGYTMTVHKAQGSQFPHVVIVLTNPNMLNRNWLYTAITRAETKVDIVGPKQWLIEAINTQGDVDKRRSFLGQLLKHKKFNT